MLGGLFPVSASADVLMHPFSQAPESKTTLGRSIIRDYTHATDVPFARTENVVAVLLRLVRVQVSEVSSRLDTIQNWGIST